MDSYCAKCLNEGTEICEKCLDNPKYRDFGRFYKEYEPSCPYGYDDCISDPAYIKHYYPDWYKDLYGDAHINEVRKNRCFPLHRNYPDRCPNYDDEDK